MKYLIVSAMVTDSITRYGDNEPVVVGGGAGWYAYAGARIWTDAVLPVTGIGEDFTTLHNKWFVRNSVDTSGLMIRDACSPVTRITYFEDGEREEVPLRGLEHFRNLEAKPEDIALWCSNCSGVYVFKNLEDSAFWEGVIQLKAEHGFTLMWEIAADAAVPENLARFEQVLSQIDILSINAAESFSLFGTDNEDEIVKRLKSYQLSLIYFRRGRLGAFLIQNDTVTAVPSIDSFTYVDPTGAGNSSSAAVLVGFCQNREPLETGLMGSISAGYIISQFGPPENVGMLVRDEARALLAMWRSRMKQRSLTG